MQQNKVLLSQKLSQKSNNKNEFYEHFFTSCIKFPCTLQQNLNLNKKRKDAA